MFVEPPFDPEQGFSETDIDVTLRRRSELARIIDTAVQLVNGNRQLVFQLNTVA
jgi:hypothetical protein